MMDANKRAHVDRMLHSQPATSNVAIARLARVTDTYVGRRRKELGIGAATEWGRRS